MKNRRILSLIAVVLTMSILSSYVFADGDDENDRKNDDPIEETQIDEDLNRQILEYLENLDESELDPNRNEDHYEHRLWWYYASWDSECYGFCGWYLYCGSKSYTNRTSGFNKTGMGKL